jgi:hypothetical protein
MPPARQILSADEIEAYHRDGFIERDTQGTRLTDTFAPAAGE